MRKVRPTEVADYDTEGFVALEVLSGEHSNVRMIRLSPGTTLPPHTHGASDLFLHVVEGTGELDTPDGPIQLRVGDLAHLRGDEELRLSNGSTTGLTLLAFLAPAFPPASSDDPT